MEIEESVALFTDCLKVETKTEKLPLQKALQHITARDIYAPISVPNFPKSAMDGYAVRASDTFGASIDKPKALKVLGIIYAGDGINFDYQKDCCVRIMTGAAIPSGFDAVVKQENTNLGEQECLIYKSVKENENYCSIGEDVQASHLLIPAGTILQPMHLGILASCGIDLVEVRSALKVGILTTGSELVPLGETLEYGKIYNSISYVLQAALQKQGVEVSACEQCDDDLNKLKEALLKFAEQVDFIITTGGISVGERDLVPIAFKALQGSLIFAKANIQPGAPTQGWLLNGTPVLCLSGNPYAAYANFELYFWESVAKMLSCDDLKVKTGLVILQNDITKHIKHRRLLRGFVQAGAVTVPDSKHSASVIGDLLGCNCFVDVSPEQSLTAGSKVKIRFFK